jgi:eukaryotic-like serine/threonine-protein kinase
MTDPTDNAPQHEPLAAPAKYESTPTNQLFPAWERNLKFAALGALLVVAVAGSRYWKAQQPAPVIAEIHFPEAKQWTAGAGLTLSPAFSHSGKIVAYASDRDGSGTLAIWTQPFDSQKATRLTLGEFNESDPDFSPDDRQLVFRSEKDGGGIYVVPADGSAPPRLVAKDGWRPRFSPDGKWIAFCTITGSEDKSFVFGSGKVFVVPSEGGEPRGIQPDFPFARFPIWAPDSRRLLFTGTRGDGMKDWWVAGLTGGEAIRTHAVERLGEQLRAVGMPEQWKGDRIFFTGAEEAHPHIWALPVSLSSWQVSGSPSRLTDGPGMEQQCSLGPDGSLLFTSMKLDIELYSLSIEPDHARVTGKMETLTHHGGKEKLPYMAYGGSKVVYVSDQSGMRDIWINDVNGKTEERVTTFRQVGFRPVISADGKTLVYPAFLNGKCAVLMQRAALDSRPGALQGCFAVWDWSQDGTSLLTFRSIAEMNKVELVRLPSQDRRPVLIHPKRNFYGARFSPDGRWIAFTSGTGSAQACLFVAPLRDRPTPEAEWVSMGPDSGGEPAWSPDGNVLYYRSKRDGFHCIWAQKLGPGKRPSGEPVSIQHLHSAGFGLYLMNATDFNLTVGNDRLVFNVVKAGNTLWTARLEDK